MDKNGKLLDQVAVPTRRSDSIDGVKVGRLVRAGGDAPILVDFPLNPMDGPVTASATVGCCQNDVNRAVALAFVDGDPGKPIVLGFMHESESSVVPSAGEDEGARATADIDGARQVFEADQEIVLRCGRASITLTRSGKIILRGRYLLSRSSGVNRIKGGSVQIN